jgi:Flp pilus assembly protein TadG
LNRIWKYCTEESGQAIAEFAVLLPVFALVSFAIIDIQWMTKQAANIDYIANEVARCDALGTMNPTAHMPCSPPGNGAAPNKNSSEDYAKALARNLRVDVSTTAFTVTTLEPPCQETPPSPALPNTCNVTITLQYKPLGAWFPNLTISRTGTASYVPPPPAP